MTVLLAAASLVPLLAGVIGDTTGTAGIFMLVSVMYAITAVAVWFGPQTHGIALEELTEELAGSPDWTCAPASSHQP